MSLLSIAGFLELVPTVVQIDLKGRHALSLVQEWLAVLLVLVLSLLLLLVL